MDTRTKIIDYQRALELARRLRDIRSHAGCEQLIVFVADPADPVLPARARCELLAGMSAVDLVATATDIPDLPNAYHEEEADRARLERLIQRVHARA